MNILVTGSEGYIGSQLVPTLQQCGHMVVGLDTGFYSDATLYPVNRTQATQRVKDVRHITAEDLEGFDAVVHLAELSNDPLGQFNPEITYHINQEGSIRLAKLCKQVGIERFVYASSCSVYGIGTNEIKTETSELNPQTVYAHCKVLVEQALSSLADAHFSPTCLRNATAFGASPRMRFDIVLNNLAGLAWTTGKIAMISDGTPWRPLVHVLDICDAVAAVLEAPREAIHNQIFNVGDSEQNYQVRDIAHIVASVFSGCELTFGPTDADNRSYRVSFEKLQRHLPSFRCRRDAAYGAQELYRIFQAVDFNSDQFQHRTFTRLKQLLYLLSTEQLNNQLFWTRESLLKETNGVNELFNAPMPVL